MGTKRIGHGFQLFLFPYLINLCKKLDICFEVCPISNMVLDHVGDMRQHPISHLIQHGL